MKTLIIGAGGQLGKCIRDVVEQTVLKNINKEYYFATHDDFDITDKSSMVNYMYCHFIPDYIVNCAAYTNVEKAEDDVYGAFKVNLMGVKNLVDICEEYNIALIHISTDYVYKSKIGPINEDDQIEPINIYGESKRDGELQIINSNLKNWYIFRTSWLYSEYDNNFVTKMITNYKKSSKLYGVADEIGSPTYARKLAMCIIDILENIYYENGDMKSIPSGIYNFSGLGCCSRLKFAETIIDGISHTEHSVTPITQYEAEKMWNLKAQRPNNTVLDNTKINLALKTLYKGTYALRDNWHIDLAECLNRYDELQKEKH